MSWWNTISAATRVPQPVANAIRNQGGGGAKRPAWLGPWMVVGTIVFVLWAIGSGTALVWTSQFERELVDLVPVVAVTLVILAMLGVLVGWTLMKAPAGHFLSVYGKRLVWVAPVALVVGAAIVPVAVQVVTITNDQATRLAASYLGAKPAANLCSAAGLEATPTPRPAGR